MYPWIILNFFPPAQLSHDFGSPFLLTQSNPMGNGVSVGVAPEPCATDFGVAVGLGLHDPHDEPYSQLPQSRPHHVSGARVGFTVGFGVAPPASGVTVGVVGQSPICMGPQHILGNVLIPAVIKVGNASHCFVTTLYFPFPPH